MSTQYLIEVKPGEGGQDAEVFASELVDVLQAMLGKVTSARIKTSINASRSVELVVSAELVARLSLDRLAGTHRIQRIPTNSKAGRRHTSTASISLTELETKSRVIVREGDLLEQVHRGSGKGGQHQNTSDSAVRLIHMPSGIKVEISHGRSQGKNRQEARKILAQKLAELYQQQRQDGYAQTKRCQVSGADRPSKTWTWNTQRGEVIEHASGSRFALESFRKGKISLK